MDFQLSEEQTLIQDMAKNFAASELAPYSSKWDEEKFLDRNVFKRAAELGFLGIYTGEEHGGTALSRLDSALVFEQLAAGDVSHTAMMTIHNMATWMIDRYGDDAVRAKYVPRLTAGDLIASYCLTEPGAGSDAASLQGGRIFMSLWRGRLMMGLRASQLSLLKKALRVYLLARPKRKWAGMLSRRRKSSWRIAVSPPKTASVQRGTVLNSP